MRPQRVPWPEVHALFDQALDLDGDARRAFVARACVDNADAGRALEALLAADAQAQGFLERPAIARFEGLIAREVEADSGADDDIADVRAGTFRLLRALGRGGMGTVYLAERVEADFRQLAAVKLLRDGFGSDERRRRFVHERRILAGLQHDGIARMLDGGIASDGRPYFAMEYVEGKVLTTACDDLRLSIDDRLAHFLTVCDAVAYLHRNLVVHRDLKPSNVMLADDAGGMRTKLLDFGIAKLLADDDEGAAQTRAELRMFTPEYAAPEQLRGETITTATDVYALGLLLHELLTGARARDAPASERNDPLWMPPRPSVACARGDDANARAESRGLRVSALRKRLAGDLDRIVQHALEPDPFARYPSAEALAIDVRRHRAGLPVIARGAGFAYVATRFVQRHRIAVGASAAVLVALITGLALALHQRARATIETKKADEVREFALGLFRFADPDIAKGKDFRVRELLDRGAKRVIEELDGQTEVQLELGLVIADAQTMLGANADSLPLWDRLVTWTEALHGRDSTRVADILNRRGNVLDVLNDYGRAEADFARSLSIRLAVDGGDSKPVVESKRLMAGAFAASGKLDEAERLAREALAIARAARPPDGDEIHACVCAMASMLVAELRFADAEPFAREAYAYARTSRDPDSSLALTCEYQLGMTLQGCGKQDEAFDLLSDGLARRRRVLPQGHPDIALSLITLAGVESDRGHLDVADDEFSEAVKIDSDSLGPDNDATLDARSKLAFVRFKRGQFAAAVAEMEQVHAAYVRAFGPDHPRVATAKGNLASFLEFAGRGDDAERMQREVVAWKVARFGEDDPDTVKVHQILGQCLMRRGDPLGAKHEFEVAAAHGTILDPTSALTLDQYSCLGDAQLALEDFAGVIESQTETLRRCSEDPTLRVRAAWAHMRMGRARLAQGGLDEADAELHAAIDVLSDGSPPNRHVWEARRRLAEVDVARGHDAEARAKLEALLAEVPDETKFAELRNKLELALADLSP